jgi:hypothetical protein
MVEAMMPAAPNATTTTQVNIDACGTPGRPCHNVRQHHRNQHFGLYALCRPRSVVLQTDKQDAPIAIINHA